MIHGPEPIVRQVQYGTKVLGDKHTMLVHFELLGRERTYLYTTSSVFTNNPKDQRKYSTMRNVLWPPLHLYAQYG